VSDRSSSEQRAFIEALQRGEPAAFRALIERHQRPLYMLCLRLMSDVSEAEDMTQETFIKASQAISSFRHESLLSTWLYRIATNLCKNRIGYLKRRQQSSHDHLASLEAKAGDLWQGRAESVVSHDQPEVVAESKEAQEIIIQALDSLPEKQKTALTLRDIQGLSYAEIADITGASLGTVKSRIHQGRLLLVKVYQALLNGEGRRDD
jgi:RNA polymerase sigma-70 factor, ECF subfamily